MKRRPHDGALPAAGGGGGFEKGRGKCGGSSRKRRNEQRLGGGGGLSLESFTNAKSRSTGYNPALIKKQKEFYRNAKFIHKYNKSLKQQSQPSDHPQIVVPVEGSDDAKDVPRPTNKRKKHTSQSLERVYEKKRTEDEKAKKERDAIIQAKREERERSEVKRKDLRDKMFQKTRSGQPVMKYRIQHLLESALESSNT